VRTILEDYIESRNGPPGNCLLRRCAELALEVFATKGGATVARASCLAALAALSALASCSPAPPAGARYDGPNPLLPAPRHRLIPTIKIAHVVGWAPGETPLAAPGFKVAAFAVKFIHPRWLYVLPDGDVLVAETNAPAHPPAPGLAGMAEKTVMAAAGADVPSPNRIILLRDSSGKGVADTRTVFLKGLNSPYGMALVGDQLYVADTDALLRFPYRAGETKITAPAVRVVNLPGGPIDHHWTKNVVASPDGSKLYVTVGSNSNAGENGLAAEQGRAAVWLVDPASGRARIFASGLRNPNGLDFEPATGALWTVVNERDELGDELAPDYLTSVRDGAFYGWPYSYWGQHADVRVKPARPDLVRTAVAPDYSLTSHVAPLGMTFYRGDAFPPAYRSGAFIGEHGSWNRSTFSGYKVVFVPFIAGKPAGPPRDVLTGFLSPKGEAHGRPVGVVEDKSGALLVADDVGDIVWRVTASGR
jgi:glucose/arabinose dehydrogenase